eukprot:COSAG01_NODE_1433_length_10317_cov_590.337366_12_plen_109_part_00
MILAQLQKGVNEITTADDVAHIQQVANYTLYCIEESADAEPDQTQIFAQLMHIQDQCNKSTYRHDDAGQSRVDLASKYSQKILGKDKPETPYLDIRHFGAPKKYRSEF